MQAMETYGIGSARAATAGRTEPLVETGVIAVALTFAAVVLAVGFAFGMQLSAALITSFSAFGAGGLVYLLSAPILRRFPAQTRVL